MRRNLLIGAAALTLMLLAGVIEYALFIGWDARTGRTVKNVTASMAPAILPGEWITIRPLESHARMARGDIVVHAYPPDPSKQFIKRILGLPGDTLAMVRGALSVNGRVLREPYAWVEDSASDPSSDDFAWQRQYLAGARSRDTAAYVATRDNWGPLVVPPGMYFVLGDNRDNSLDSRYFGFIPASDLVGRVRRIYFSQDSAGHLRFGRLGRRPE